MSLEKLCGYVCVRPGWKSETLFLFLYNKIVDRIIDRMDRDDVLNKREENPGPPIR